MTTTRWCVFALALAGAGVSASPASGQSGCTQWVMASPGTRPIPRYSHVLAFDSIRGKTVLFGGNVAGGTAVPPTYANDTWEWDGVNWVEVNTPTRPPVRGAATMVFDSARGVCVLFGGQNTTGRLGDTWEYNGATWTQRFSPGPGPVRRLSHFMAYDSRRGVTVLYGGYGGLQAVGTLLGDTWEWDGQTWTPKFTLVTPLPRVSGGMAYDSIRGRVVMFAGGGDFRATAETWEYDGTDWSLRFNNVAFWRITPAMCFDSARGQTLAFGGILGNIRYADEFEWDGLAWDNFDIPGPIGRSDSLMAYDSHRRRAVLFGGESQQPARLNDTWELVNLNPILISQSPRGQTVQVGGTALLTVAASGNGLTYQWRRNLAPIPGATDPALLLSPVTLADRGEYDCVVSNPCGSRASDRATLTVQTSECPADINGDGVLNPDDLGDFLDLFFQMGLPADFNGDGRIDPDDLGDFINQYFVGC